MKDLLRKKYKILRKEFQNNKEASCIAAEKFLSSDEYKKCRRLFIFASYGSEINTWDIISKSLNDGKLTALPYMTGKPHEMVFIRINSVNELCQNKIGIYEPLYNEKNVVVSDDTTIIAVPGLVYDTRGYRVGYGGGYYDKYLLENKYMLSVGLAFDFQIADKVPNDEYDVKTDMIITEGRKIFI